MKICRACNTTKPYEEFSSGRAVCKPCRNSNMKAYYVDNRNACIERAKRWAEQNPDKKREINKASNIRNYGTPSVQVINSEDLNQIWNEFRHDYAMCETIEDVDALCDSVVLDSAFRVVSLPTDIEDVLADWEERHG